MVVCTFRPNTDMDEVATMAPEEMTQAQLLHKEGVLSAVRVSLARDKVFLEISATDTKSCEAAVQRLPMSKWWEIETYQIASPV